MQAVLAKESLRTGHKVLEWARSSENSIKLKNFCDELVVMLEQCFKDNEKGTMHSYITFYLPF